MRKADACGRKARACERAAQEREESPMLETLEAVDEQDDRRAAFMYGQVEVAGNFFAVGTAQDELVVRGVSHFRF